LDASVAVKAFVSEEHSPKARELLARFAREDGAELIVPDLFFSECANVFWKWVWRSHYPAQSARAHLHDLTRLGLTVWPAKLMAVDALEIALTHNISAYDACYVAAAAAVGFPLITADERLVRQAAAGGYDIRWLGDALPA
jgi:predicted nucleic acid-binding protein